MGREREVMGEGKGKNTQYVKFTDLLLNFFGRVPQKIGGRIRSLGRCRRAGSQRLPQTRTGRTSINAEKPYQSHIDNDFQNRVSRVSEWLPVVSRPSPKMSFRPSSAFVVAVLLCSLVDPRDRQEVLAAEGIHPHPGPGLQQGAVMQEVESIEERMQRQKRAEDREKVKGGEKKQRCSPPLWLAARAPLLMIFLRVSRRGEKREAKMGVSKTAAVKIKVTKVKKPRKHPTSLPTPSPKLKKR